VPSSDTMKAGTNTVIGTASPRADVPRPKPRKQAQVFLVRRFSIQSLSGPGPLQGLAYRDLVVHERLKSLLVHPPDGGAMMKV